MAGSDIRVASGNFVTAKPIGVVDGVDLVHTGEVRKIDVAGIRDRLDHNELVLLSPLGYSPTGEIFNLALEDVAMSAAVALGAEKLIFLMDTPGVVTGKRAELKHELTCSQAEKLLARAGALAGDVTLYLPRAVSACRAGVKRAHLISRHADGALLLELFTRRGVGTMLTQDPLEKLRPARIDDIGGVLRAAGTARGRRHAGQARTRSAGNGNRALLRARARPRDRRLRRALSVRRRHG